MKNKVFIYALSGVLLLGAFALAAFLYKNSEKERLSFLASSESELFVRDYSPRYGNPEAKVVISEFLDPECESCRAFYPVVKSLMKEFDDKVQLVLRYAPFHGNSELAIRALEAARFQNKYWEALELLFYTQPQWGDHHHPRPELIFEYLSQMGLDMERLKTDMASPKIQEMIDQDKQDLRALKIRGTPTFFVNGQQLQDFSEEGLRSLLRSEIEKAYP